MQLIWGKILKKLKMLIIKIFQRNNNSYTSEKNANTSSNLCLYYHYLFLLFTSISNQSYKTIKNK